MQQTTDNPKVIIAQAPPGLGVGLYARSRIHSGEGIATFDGPIYTWSDVKVSIDPSLPNNPRDHAIQFAARAARDSQGFARYANHSCRPNCGIVDRFNIVAMRMIEKGEEILWDYDMSEDSVWSMRCRCGADNCRGIIAGYRFLPPPLRRAYRSYISEWLLASPRAFLGNAAEAWLRYPHPLTAEPSKVLEAIGGR